MMLIVVISYTQKTQGLCERPCLDTIDSNFQNVNLLNHFTDFPNEKSIYLLF